jgi:hypothetical protein
VSNGKGAGAFDDIHFQEYELVCGNKFRMEEFRDKQKDDVTVMGNLFVKGRLFSKY